MKLTKEEKEYLTILVQVEMDMIGFITGFAKLTEKDKRQKEFYNKLIKKLNDSPV